jgi:hypothetical protein
VETLSGRLVALIEKVGKESDINRDSPEFKASLTE